MRRSERRSSGSVRGARAGPGRAGGRPVPEAGFVTAETAVVLPVLVAVAAALIWGLMVACARIACVDAARAGARAAARSEPAARVLTAARGAAPKGARIAVAREGDLVRVRVEADLPGVGRMTVRVGGEAVALAEETVR
ncbi:TadE family type IV pilus minor pilin [Streptomyces sp. CT34]|uniref:TadE family type IV pilus minor pilin n=1 Tax=Streptomyces sp. CT34 TaxID=1553907 RepID=UPI00099D75C7|nr:TadE family type IV pilus minor pilin [Streptomyces sp. CT34]